MVAHQQASFDLTSHVPLVLYPHPVLRWKSAEVRQIDDNLRRTVDQMFELMYDNEGLGLAANQVGLPLRFFVVNMAEDPKEHRDNRVFINPVLRNRKGSEQDEEGCLSFPTLFGPVTRAGKLVVEAFDLKGELFEMSLSGMAARVIQHENDHLDGLLFIDKIPQSELADFEATMIDLIKLFEAAQAEGQIKPKDQLTKELAAIAEKGQVPADFAI